MLRYRVAWWLSRRACARRLLLAVTVSLSVAMPAQAAPPAPAAFVGHQIGADFKLVRWPAILRYFELVAQESSRVRIAELGQSTSGNRMIAAIVSSPENLAAADEYRDIARRLAAARGMSDEQARSLAEKGKAVVAITLNLHATEIASSQMALELIYTLATDESAATRHILDRVILLLIPSLNPDGQIMVCDWYEKTLGTPFEGGRLPWLSHPYAGHDNNRDWFMLNLIETRHVTKFLYQDWHPQALHDQHQMGTGGPRIFVPPYFDPINPNVHPLVWRAIAMAGSTMAARLEERQFSGVVSSALYDGWRPGDMDTTPWWHNIPAVLTEVASARIASPIFVKPEELKGGVRGLPAYSAQMNFPNPWPGGWWRLRDIVDYELTCALAFLEFAAQHKTDLLLNSFRMNRDAIRRGQSEPPYAFVIPATSNDPWTVGRLIEPLRLAGVDVHRASDAFVADAVRYPAGSHVVLMSQPLRPYVKDLLEPQRYPDRRLYPGGPPEPPYDEAGWTLPLKMGLEVVAVDKPFEAMLEPVRSYQAPAGGVAGTAGAVAVACPPDSNASILAVNRWQKAGREVGVTRADLTAGQQHLPAGSFVVKVGSSDIGAISRTIEALSLNCHGLKALPAVRPLARPRVGIYQPWGGSADEGWTRWVFDQFELPFQTVHAEDVKAGNLTSRFDTIILPSMTAHQLQTGEASPQVTTPTLPPPYAGGLGETGAQGLVSFVRDGGTLIALDAATEWAIEHLNLPVRNVLRGLKPDEFYCPGSLLEVSINRSHPVTAALGSRAHVFFLHSPAFEVLPAFGDQRPVVLAAYGKGQVLASGWLVGAERLAGRAAVVEVLSGRGRALLIGFRCQFRGQTYGTIKLLFGAIFHAASGNR